MRDGGATTYDGEHSALFGLNCRIRMREKGITPGNVAEAIGMEGDALSRLLTGKGPAEIELDVANSIADALRVDIDRLLAEQRPDLSPEARYLLSDPEVAEERVVWEGEMKEKTIAIMPMKKPKALNSILQSSILGDILCLKTEQRK